MQLTLDYLNDYDYYNEKSNQISAHTQHAQFTFIYTKSW